MKIAITGHTQGIGKAVYELLSKEHEVLGFSRSNGYDITNTEQRQNLISSVETCDVFINNAYAIRYQTELLKVFCKKWKDAADKFIIHIGSKWIFYPPPDYPEHRLYRKEKQEQEKISNEYLTSFSPKVCNILLGPTDTDMVKDWTIPKIPTTAVADTIKNIIDTKDYVFVQKIILDSTHR